jgi:hypothetical protein
MMRVRRSVFTHRTLNAAPRGRLRDPITPCSRTFTVCLVSVHDCEIVVLCRTAVHAKVVLHEPAVQHSEAFTCERAAAFSHTVTSSHASLGSFTIDTTQCGPGVVTDGAVRYKSTRIFQPLASGANRANEPGPLQHDVGVAQELTTLKARCVAVHGRWPVRG